MNMEKIVI